MLSGVLEKIRFQIGIRISYGTDEEILSFTINEHDEREAKLQAVKKAMNWIEPGREFLLEILSIKQGI